jgi:hypothetical protein
MILTTHLDDLKSCPLEVAILSQSHDILGGILFAEGGQASLNPPSLVELPKGVGAMAGKLLYATIYLSVN